MGRKSVEQVVYNFEEIEIIEQEISSIDRRARDLVDNKDRYDFSQLSFSFIDSEEMAKNKPSMEVIMPKGVNAEMTKNKRITIIEPIGTIQGEEEFFETSVEESIQILSIMLENRKKRLGVLNENINKLMKNDDNGTKQKHIRQTSSKIPERG